jgi:hypothetical protein
MRDPKYLLELKIRAEKALNSEPPDGLAGFAAAWTLWEAVRRRMLILACKREGWTVQQAHDALTDESIDNPRFVRLYEIITSGQKWEESLPLPAGKIWPTVSDAVHLRNRIIYGTSRAGDIKLQRTTWKILRFVDLLRDHPLGNPLKELPKKSRKIHPDESLAEILRKI